MTASPAATCLPLPQGGFDARKPALALAFLAISTALSLEGTFAAASVFKAFGQAAIGGSHPGGTVNFLILFVINSVIFAECAGRMSS
ncbi:MAG TPA: hypothetical protein VIU29_00930 [Candidatus Deferrimicrobiaceae bacterium]